MDAGRIAGVLGGRGCGVYGLPISSGRKGQRSWLFWTRNFSGRKGQRSWLLWTLERGRRLAVVLGIDPGISGALALVERDGRGAFKVLQIEPLPLWTEQTKTGKVRRYIDLPPLLALLASMEADCIVCERMIAAPGIAGSTAFSMGATMGVIQAALRAHGARHKLVVSSVWKRALECPSDKEAARLFAGRLFGSDDFWPLKKDHNKAEAALIAAWGAMTL